AAPAATTAAALAPATAATATATGGLHVPLLDRRRGRLGGGRLALRIVHHQNSNPPLRAPSATAFTRPWYWYPPRSKTTLVMPFAFARLAISWPSAKLRAVFPVPSTCTPSGLSAAPTSVTPRPSSTTWPYICF